MSSYHIRFARSGDESRIVDLCREHAAFEKTEYPILQQVKALQHQLFKESAPLKCLVVDSGSDLAGYATFMKQFSTWRAQFYLYLDCIYLIPKCRGAGIGRQLMEQIKQIAKKEQLEYMEWQTPSFNQSAIRFYNRLGAGANSKQRYSWNLENLG